MSAWETEAALVAEFITQLRDRPRWGKQDCPWTIYPETAGWDLLLQHRDGFQLGLEAKLSLNAKVVAQALDGQHRYYRPEGPDFRGVLVPAKKVQHDLRLICDAIGIGIIGLHPVEPNVYRTLSLPGEDTYNCEQWPHWCPAERCPLPAYVPDVEAGKPSPVALTDWKIKAIKLMIVLERRGFVTRRDMRALKISPSRWTDCWHGFLTHGDQGYVRCSRTPDLKAQHPRNYAEIEADFDIWASEAGINADPLVSGGTLL